MKNKGIITGNDFTANVKCNRCGNEIDEDDGIVFCLQQDYKNDTRGYIKGKAYRVCIICWMVTLGIKS